MDEFPIDPEIDVKLKRIFGKGSNKELIPYKPLFKKHFRYFKLEGFNRRMNYFLNKKVPDIPNETYNSFFKKLVNNDINVYLKGGAVRDIFLNKEPNDFDIIIQTDEEKLRELCEKYKWPCAPIDTVNQFIAFSGKIECLYNGDKMKNMSNIEYDYTCNWVLYEFSQGILIDMCLFGVQDCIDRKIRITVAPKYFKAWASSDWKKPLRAIKLVQLGFNFYNPFVQRLISDYIEQNFQKVYMKHMSFAPISRIDYFLLRSLAKIDVTVPNYIVNSKDCKLIKNFVNTLSKYIKPEYIDMITANNCNI
jgi:hypothetical protein